MDVHLTYFYRNGIYLGQAVYQTERQRLFEIWRQVENKLRYRKLPGLVKQHNNLIILVSVPSHPHNMPRLVFMDETQLARRALSNHAE